MVPVISDKISKLEIEAARGDRYKSVYEQYVEPFFELKQKELFDHFCDCLVEDKDRAANILHMSKALESLKNHFIHYIETGEMAKQTLNEANK